MIPEGYRLLTINDLDKRIGVHLSPIVYLDTTKTNLDLTGIKFASNIYTNIITDPYQTSSDIVYDIFTAYGSVPFYGKRSGVLVEKLEFLEQTINLNEKLCSLELFYVQDLQSKNIQLHEGNTNFYPRTKITNLLDDNGYPYDITKIKLQMANDKNLGGVKAHHKPNNDKLKEVVIDPNTGILYTQQMSYDIIDETEV